MKNIKRHKDERIIEKVKYYGRDYYINIHGTIRWSSNDRDVVTMSGNGMATGKGIGYTTIYASSMDGSNKSQSTTVVVKPAKIAMKSVKLAKTSKRKIAIKVKGSSRVCELPF